MKFILGVIGKCSARVVSTPINGGRDLFLYPFRYIKNHLLSQ